MFHFSDVHLASWKWWFRKINTTASSKEVIRVVAWLHFSLSLKIPLVKHVCACMCCVRERCMCMEYKHVLRSEGDVQCLPLFLSALLSWNTVSVISQYSPESISLHTPMLDLQILTVISVFHTHVLGVSNDMHNTHCCLLNHILNNHFSFFSWPWLFFLYHTSNSPFWKGIRELLFVQQHISVFPVQFSLWIHLIFQLDSEPAGHHSFI